MNHTLVMQAYERAKNYGFMLSSEKGVGQLLVTLAAGVKKGGRILEIGTGVGAGTAHLVTGLEGRSDVDVVTVELNPKTSSIAQEGNWPEWVTFQVGNVLDLFSDLGQFDLIFADAPGGKWEGLEQTISAVKPGGMLVVDDMTPQEWADADHEYQTKKVRDSLLSHSELMSCELSVASGVILSARKMR